MNNILYLANHSDPMIRKEWQEATNSYEKKLNRIVKAAQIATVFLNNRMAKSSIVKTNVFYYIGDYSWHTELTFSIYHAPVEMIIDFFCSIGKQTFGVDWTMRAEEEALVFSTNIQGLLVKVKANLDEHSVCKIIKKTSYTPPDVKPQTYNDYFLDCSE